MFDELYFVDRTNNSRIQDDVYIYSKDDIRIQKISIIKIALENITEMENIKKVIHWNIKFEGFPSVWNVGNIIDLVTSILNKPDTFKIILDSFLKSGLLYNYWRCYILTILGCLEEIDDEDIKKYGQVLQNLFAAIPEKIKNKPSMEVYIQRLILLRNEIRKLCDTDLIKNAGKMAGFIIKNESEFSIFETHLERRKT